MASSWIARERFVDAPDHPAIIEAPFFQQANAGNKSAGVQLSMQPPQMRSSVATVHKEIHS
jgi:hypothetical protein